MDWINKYEVDKTEGRTVITGDFTASSGNFRIVHEGDGGNADTTTITLNEGQFDNFEFTITGAWEIREVIGMFKLLGESIQ